MINSCFFHGPNKSIKAVQTQINLDLTYLVKLLNANKIYISLNASKTKVLIFRHQNKPIMCRKKSGYKLKQWDIKIKIDGKKLEQLPILGYSH